MVFCDPIVDVESFRETVDVVWLLAEKVNDPSAIGASAGPGENIPEQTSPGSL